jgi:hypothetical protein
VCGRTQNTDSGAVGIMDEASGATDVEEIDGGAKKAGPPPKE